jgi:hypothetical protein
MRLALPESQSSHRRSTHRQEAMVRRATASDAATKTTSGLNGRAQHDAVEEGDGGHDRADEARADGASGRLRRGR